jgi:iron complex outermembrane recepter protein
MNIASLRYYFCAVMLFLAMFFILGNSAMQAQTKQLLAWQGNLESLQKATDNELQEQQVTVAQLRNAIEFWIKYHPSTKAILADAPKQPWGVKELRSQVAELQKAVETILKEDPNRPFHMGSTEISVSAEISPLSPVVDSLNSSEISNRQILTAAAVLDAMPGMEALHPSGQRNEAQGLMRGFSTRGQVPFYTDGIPVYMPYDGYVDLNRFTLSDVSEVQVAKGYSSPMLGPNGLAGSINLVTKKPENKFESDALIGTGSGNELLAALRLGTRWEHFYLQGSLDWLQHGYIPLSGNFPLSAWQTNYNQFHSDTNDEKHSARIAWTPKGQDQYTFSYINQKGQKLGLFYLGPNPSASQKYWRWPYWDKNSYYFISNTGIGDKSSIKFHIYYDQFKNQIDMFDDATLKTMNNKKSEHSLYDDHADGASAEFDTHIFAHHNIGASFYFKDDTHRSRDIYPAVSPYPFIYPDLTQRAQQQSIGFQDLFTLIPRLHLAFGFSADHMNGLHAATYNLTNTATVPVICTNSLNNTSFDGCTAHVWTYNLQESASYNLSSNDTLFAIFSDRSRFPLLKESYSYSMRQGLPNPDLKPERSRNLDFGYSRSFTARTLLQIEYFRSDLRNAIESPYVPDVYSQCSNQTKYPGYCNQNFNAGKEVHEGAEISIRSTPMPRLTLNASYSYINRTVAWDYNMIPSGSITSLLTLPVMPKNKFVANVTMNLPYEILAMVSMRYEGGIVLQDSTYGTNAPIYAGSYGTVDIGTVIPIPGSGIKIQTGIRNLFDRNYYYTAGYPEEGRNWYFSLRHRI